MSQMGFLKDLEHDLAEAEHIARVALADAADTREHIRQERADQEGVEPGSFDKWVHLAGDLEGRRNGRFVDIRVKGQGGVALFIGQTGLLRALAICPPEKG